MTATRIGRFVWYDLMTPEPAEATSFYENITGWTVRSGENGSSTLLSSQGALGAAVELPELARATGERASWLASVSVVNVDTAVAKVRELGGRVITEPQTIPDFGRVAVITDPQGVALALLTPTSDTNDQDGRAPGAFCWSELSTTNHLAAFAFYGSLFGWEILGEHLMGLLGSYLVFGQDGHTLGGMFTKPIDIPLPPAWVHYVHVADLDSAMQRATEKGGRLLIAPHDIPGGARVAQFLDPQGARFALLQDPLQRVS